MPSFNDFALQPSTKAVLDEMHITEPTLIQQEAIPALLSGNDVVGQAPTGSGKTLAYSIPLVERLTKERVPQALILVPTRELAMQVNEVLTKLASSRRLTTALLVGGRPYNSQISALRYGSQIIVGTPGRIKDHLDRGTLSLTRIRMCVLDEADQMLDSGFAPAIEEILETAPSDRQMALFSATMPDWVEKLKQKFLKNPVNVTIDRSASGDSTIEQTAYSVPQAQKIAALCTLLYEAQGESSLVFGRTKYGVERLGKQLSTLGYTVGTLHGNKSQSAREAILSAFRQGRIQTLIATNVAARGLDIKGIYQVINYELPESSELFTHRIGRTGRMGQSGKAITLLAPAEVAKWRRMARTLGQEVVIQHLTLNEEAMKERPIVQPEPVAMPARRQAEERRPSREHSQTMPRPEPFMNRSERRAPRNDENRMERRAPQTDENRFERRTPRTDENRMERRAPQTNETRSPRTDENRSERPTRRPADISGERSRISTEQAESFFKPERSFSEQTSGDNRNARKPSRVGRIARRQTSPESETRSRSFRGNGRGSSQPASSRRTTSSKRFASR